MQFNEFSGGFSGGTELRHHEKREEDGRKFSREGILSALILAANAPAGKTQSQSVIDPFREAKRDAYRADTRGAGAPNVQGKRIKTGNAGILARSNSRGR